MTKEQIRKEYIKLSQEKDEILNHLLAARMKGDLPNNDEYDYWRNKLNENDERYNLFNCYFIITGKPQNYFDYLHAYVLFKDYAKRLNFSYDSLLDKKTKFLDEHLKHCEQYNVTYDYYPLNFLEMPREKEEKNKKFFKSDLKNVLQFFQNKEDKELYKWEMDYITFLLFYDQLLHTSYKKDILNKYEVGKRNKECDEYINNCDHILKDLDNGILDFNLLIWTIYHIYHYFKNQDISFVIPDGDIQLIDKLLCLSFSLLSVDYNERVVKENNELDDEENYFMFYMSQLLCLDLIHTILNGFPSYYSENIMFMGHNLYSPAGCSGSSLDMDNFDKYLIGLTDYSFWFEISGKETFDKLNINNNYQEVLKDNDLI